MNKGGERVLGSFSSFPFQTPQNTNFLTDPLQNTYVDNTILLVGKIGPGGRQKKLKFIKIHR